MALETKYLKVIRTLEKGSDNEKLASECIRELVNLLIDVNSALELMEDDIDAMNRIAAGIYSSKIKQTLQLKEK